MMKKYKIYATGLSELEKKLNNFFESYPHTDIRLIQSSRSIATTHFVRGLNNKQIEFSIHYD